MVIHKSLRDFRPLWYSSRDGHAEGEHVNRGRDTKKTWRDSLPIDTLLYAVSVLVVAQPSSEVPEGLMNYLVLTQKNNTLTRDVSTTLKHASRSVGTKPRSNVPMYVILASVRFARRSNRFISSLYERTFTCLPAEHICDLVSNQE